MHGKTIAAISTPPGKGGVALIRISGDEAARIAERIFLPKGNKKITEVTPRVQIFGDIYFQAKELTTDFSLTSNPLTRTRVRTL